MLIFTALYCRLAPNGCRFICSRVSDKTSTQKMHKKHKYWYFLPCGQGAHKIYGITKQVRKHTMLWLARKPKRGLVATIFLMNSTLYFTSHSVTCIPNYDVNKKAPMVKGLVATFSWTFIIYFTSHTTHICVCEINTHPYPEPNWPPIPYSYNGRV